MDSSVFYDLLETPHKSDLLSDELQQLVVDYPWFVHGHMLYSKSLQLLNDSNFDEQLHKTSVYTPDREVFFNLIVSEDPAKEEESSVHVFSVDPKRIEKETKEEKIATPEKDWEDLKEEKIVFRLLEDESKKKEIVGGKDSRKTKLIVEEIVEKETNATPEEAITKEDSVEAPVITPPIEDVQKPRVLDVLEKEIIVGAVSRVIEKEVEEEHPEPVSVEERHTDKNSKEETEEETNFSSFTSMILKRAKEVHYIESNIGNQYQLGENNRFDEPYSDEESLKEKKKRLLDKFIALSPQISRGKLNEYESGNLGAESLKESDFFVTETMAKIYAQQGKIGKAKKTYKLLSLKYPEKSVYFAARIKNLDKK